MTCLFRTCCNAYLFQGEIYNLHLYGYILTGVIALIITWLVKRHLENDIEERNTNYIADKMTAKNSWGIFAFVSITLFTSTTIFFKLLEISFLENILNVGNLSIDLHTLSEHVIMAK